MTKPKRLVILRGKRFHRDHAYGTTYKFISGAGLPARVPLMPESLEKMEFVLRHVVNATKRTHHKLIDIRLLLLTTEKPYAHNTFDETPPPKGIYETWFRAKVANAEWQDAKHKLWDVLERIEIVTSNLHNGGGARIAKMIIESYTPLANGPGIRL